MSAKKLDLVGKTIAKVVAAQGGGSGPAGIFMLQFTDGTHVEFVSPGARRRLKSVAGLGGRGRNRPVSEAQLALNVA
jgi:tryptophan synthase beta subunit